MVKTDDGDMLTYKATVMAIAKKKTEKESMNIITSKICMKQTKYKSQDGIRAMQSLTSQATHSMQCIQNASTSPKHTKHTQIIITN